MGDICNVKTLSETANGKMYTCSHCINKVIFTFNNITQSLSMEYFHKLCTHIIYINARAYFKEFPYESRIHIRTEWKDFMYSFTEEEITELKELWQAADFKLKLFERYSLHIN